MPDIVLVTGASSGVGLSLAHHLAGRFHVLAAARSVDKLKAEFGANPNVTVYKADLANPESLAGFLDQILTRTLLHRLRDQQCWGERRLDRR